MNAFLPRGASGHFLRWPVLAALLLLSLGASARGGHDGGGQGGHGGSHAGAHRGGHDGRHGGARHFGGRHGGHFHRGGHAFIGLGYWPSWYPDPYIYSYSYGYPLAGVYTAPAYVQQGDEAQAAYWYYCAQSQAYYPAVTQCPAGWLRVVPGAPVQ
jgi:hypothetical protein